MKLLMMLPLRIGVGPMTSVGAEVHRTERDTGDASSTSLLSVRDGSPVNTAGSAG